MNPMKRFLFALSLALGLLAFGADCAHGQVVYGLSATTYDANNVVYNYSMTEGDYYANLYYDMAVEGYTYDFTGNLALTGASQLAVGRAEVWTQAAGTVGNCVGAFTRHYVGAYFGYVYYGSYYYSDPFGFSRFASTGYGGSGSFASAGPYSYVTYNILYLGSTAVCQTVPDNRPPVITGLGPGGGTPGQTVGVTITGSGFGTNPSVNAGDGVSVSVTGASDTQITANFAVAANAATGGRTVTVTKNGLTSNGASFTVGDPTPVITSVSPDSGGAGTDTPVTITGSGFGTNPEVTVDNGVTAAVQSASPTSIVCTFSIDGNAASGSRTVRVTSRGIGGNGFLGVPGSPSASAATAGFSVTPPPTPTLEGPGSVTRAESATFTIRNAVRGARIADWKFAEDGTSEVVTRSTNAGAATWSGMMVTSGTVSVNVTQGGRTISLSKTVTVNARSNFAFQAVQPQEVPNGFVTENGTIMKTPSPGPNQELGFFAGQLAFGFIRDQIRDNGPNHGFRYVVSMSDSTTVSGKLVPTRAYYVIAPEIKDVNSEFYRNQCGNYDPKTGQGFISGATLLANTIHHEAGVGKNSHYSFYVAAQNDPKNNLGVVGEEIVRGPSTAESDFVRTVNERVSAALNRITDAFLVEPCVETGRKGDVRRDPNCEFRGFVNFAPYQPCNSPK
jgi:hypothetical protein